MNTIMAALTRGLDMLFPDIPVYAEEVPQELPERCFLTGFAGQAQTSLGVCGRYEITGSLDITYLSPQELPDARRECNAIASRLALELNVISYGGLALRLYKHSCRVDENELHDICPFYAAVRVAQETPLMEDLDIDTRAKGG